MNIHNRIRHNLESLGTLYHLYKIFILFLTNYPLLSLLIYTKMPITVDLSVVISTLMGCIVYPQSHKWYSRNDWIQQLASKFTEMYSGMNTAAIKCNFTEIQSSKNRRIPCSDAQIEEILPYIDDIADVIANLTSIFATPSVLANLIDIDSRLVPIVLYPTLPDNKRCALHGLALTNKNKPSAPFAVRVVHTMDGAFVGVSLTYSCSDTKCPCVYEYGRRYENGLAFYDIDSIRDETYDYFLSSERAKGEKIGRHLHIKSAAKKSLCVENPCFCHSMR
eukprot:218603_1